MTSRRKFIKSSALTGMAMGGVVHMVSGESFGVTSEPKKSSNGKTIISTWKNLEANQAAWDTLIQGKTILDAIEAGVMVPEGDPKDMSVGFGGRPDREGKVTLDACIMDHHSNCGSVAFLENIKHPVQVARMVMEKTPHVMLAGEGALQFALENGFKKENLLTKKAEKEWKKWLQNSEYKPVINIENHDTIGMIGVDDNGTVAGACTTSGAAWKMRGRVGDSPIIGAGLFVDGEVGAATSTGLGEAVIKVAGSHLVVEFMRQGLTPFEACKKAVERVISKSPNYKELQVGFLAINTLGEHGGYSIHPGFSYVVYDKEGNREIIAKSAL
ncbi:MAG: N(4)-(beta-N-acetylglucosaminyl)-L-asparaginase [Cyclobacteriaceae bacterium]|nr:N(4)-(beta-N-acetylglucosaminyl)-L-asparaginase [Cyclobacteriaceae bacterium]